MRVRFHAYDTGGKGLAYLWTIDNLKITGTTTGITRVPLTSPADGKVYTLSGQLVGMSLQQLPAGIYVVNGKKVVKR